MTDEEFEQLRLQLAYRPTDEELARRLLDHGCCVEAEYRFFGETEWYRVSRARPGRRYRCTKKE